MGKSRASLVRTGACFQWVTECEGYGSLDSVHGLYVNWSSGCGILCGFEDFGSPSDPLVALQEISDRVCIVQD